MSESTLCIDHKVLDFEIPAQGNLPVGRPRVTVLIDAHSRKIRECEISFDED